MNREARRGAPGTYPAVIVAVLIVLAAAGLALRSVATETEVLPSVTLPDPTDDPAAAVVIARNQLGGFSFLGFDFGEASHTVSVQFYAQAGCFDRVAPGDSWPAPFAECTSPVSIAGLVSGGGITATGESIVVVDVEVSEDCYATVSRGDYWPPAGATCSVPGEDSND